MSTTKGQYFRVKLGGKILAMSKSCSIHKTADISEISTKDTTGNAKENECTAVGWDGSANGLVSADAATVEILNGFQLLDLVGQKVDIEYLETQGDHNRTAKPGGQKFTGKAIVNDVQLEFPDREDSTYSIQFTGTGALSPSFDDKTVS